MLLSQIGTVDEDMPYDKYLKQLEEINPSVEKFFNDVLVMDKDENVKENRLALLTLLTFTYSLHILYIYSLHILYIYTNS